MLLQEYGRKNLTASTEIDKNPGIVKILKKNGFMQKGRTWPSGIHRDPLDLYLRFEDSTNKPE